MRGHHWIDLVEEREASAPASYIVLQRRGLPTDDPDLLQPMRRRVGACLLAKKRRGFVRSVEVGEPLLAWELI